MARGRGMGFGRGFGIGFRSGIGMGNPYPFCRNFPWLPRRWWTGMYGPMVPSIYPTPYYGYPYGRWI